MPGPGPPNRSVRGLSSPMSMRRPPRARWGCGSPWTAPACAAAAAATAPGAAAGVESPSMPPMPPGMPSSPAAAAASSRPRRRCRSPPPSSSGGKLRWPNLGVATPMGRALFSGGTAAPSRRPSPCRRGRRRPPGARAAPPGAPPRWTTACRSTARHRVQEVELALLPARRAAELWRIASCRRPAAALAALAVVVAQRMAGAVVGAAPGVQHALALLRRPRHRAPPLPPPPPSRRRRPPTPAAAVVVEALEPVQVVARPECGCEGRRRGWPRGRRRPC